MTHSKNLQGWPIDRGMLTIGRSLAVSAKRFPEQIALVDTEQRLSYRQFNERVNRLAQGLGELGVEPGTHVAILFGNTIEHLQALYAVAKLGAVSVVLDIKWKSREVSEALKFFDCDLLLYDGAFQAALSDAAVGALRLGSFAGGADVSGGQRIAELTRDRPSTEPGVVVHDEDLFTIMLTGGTTGMPKGCLVNHKTYSIHSLNAAVGRGCDEHSKELAVVPIYYNSGRTTVLAHLFFGGTVYLRERFNAEETVDLVQTEQITSLALASTMCHRLLQLPPSRSIALSSLKSLRKAGLPFTRKMVEGLIERVTPNIYQAYSSTDGGQATMLRPHEQLTKLGSSGRAIWGVELDIVDAKHDPLGAGQEGEIRVRGPNLSQGYYKNLQEERLRFIDGWYYTGDVGRLDSDGYLYVVGRMKDIIKSGGINVAPKEIEEVLLLHPAVVDVAVIGVNDPEWGEAVKAMVVPRSDGATNVNELKTFCKEYLADYKVPKSFELVPDLQRNDLGKVTAQTLADRKRG